jgi:hypothetical protein
MPERYTADQINAHMATKLKRCVLHVSQTLKLRVMAARNTPSGLQVQIMGYEGHIDNGWTTVDDRRIDLL